MIDIGAGEKRQLRVDERRLARTHGEAINARDARRIEQRMDDQRIVAGAGFSIQKLRKAGNSSPRGSAVRIERPRAVTPEILAGRDRAIEARALEDGDLRVAAGGLDVQNPKAGIADVREAFRNLQSAIVEAAGIVG